MSSQQTNKRKASDRKGRYNYSTVVLGADRRAENDDDDNDDGEHDDIGEAAVPEELDGVFAAQQQHPDGYGFGCLTVRVLSWVVAALLVSNAVLLSCLLYYNIAGATKSGGSYSWTDANGANTTFVGVVLDWLPLPSEEAVLSRVAFGSCSRQDMPHPYWDTLATSYRPELALLMGDNVYGDCKGDASCQRLKTAYRDLAAHPSFRGAVTQSFPVFATLDDHDYGQADCDASNPYKDLAREMFAEFFGFPLTSLPQDGVYRSRTFGPVGRRLQVVLLDTRYNRGPFYENVGDEKVQAPYRPPDLTNATEASSPQVMLGERQWAWLERTLNEQADLRIVVSSIQVLNDLVVFEGWRHLPDERQRLYRLLRDKNALLLSGDRHVGGFYETESIEIGSAEGPRTFPPIREVTASSWTHTIPFGAYGSTCATSADCDEADPRRIGDLVRVNHFGGLDIDWTARTYTVSLRRTETTYGVAYFHDYDSDAGFVLQARNYTFIEEGRRKM